MWYLFGKSTNKPPEEQEIHNTMIYGDQYLNYGEITSHSFHFCVGALFYSHGPGKKASERPPSHPSSHIPGPQTENARVSKPCWLCVPIWPACHTSDNPWIQHNWTRKQWRTFYGSFSALRPKPLRTQAPFLKKEQPSIWLYISAAHVLIAAIFFPLSVYKRDLWRPLAGLKSH